MINQYNGGTDVKFASCLSRSLGNPCKGTSPDYPKCSLKNKSNAIPILCSHSSNAMSFFPLVTDMALEHIIESCSTW